MQSTKYAAPEKMAVDQGSAPNNQVNMTEHWPSARTGDILISRSYSAGELRSQCGKKVASYLLSTLFVFGPNFVLHVLIDHCALSILTPLVYKNLPNKYLLRLCSLQNIVIKANSTLSNLSGIESRNWNVNFRKRAL